MEEPKKQVFPCFSSFPPFNYGNVTEAPFRHAVFIPPFGLWHEWPCPMAMEEIQTKKRDGQLRCQQLRCGCFGFFLADEQLLLPRKLTCPLKINGWKMYFLLKYIVPF